MKEEPKKFTRLKLMTGDGFMFVRPDLVVRVTDATGGGSLISLKDESGVTFLKHTAAEVVALLGKETA